MKNWSTEEEEKIAEIRERFFQLGWSAEYADHCDTRTREKRLIAAAEREFNEALAEGILLDKFLTCYIC